MSKLTFDTIYDITAGQCLLDQYRVDEIIVKYEWKILFRAQDSRHRNVLLVVEKDNWYSTLRVEHSTYNFCKKLLPDFHSFPFANVYALIPLNDANILVIEDEGPLAIERMHKFGKFPKSEAVSMCVSLLNCMEALNDKALLIGSLGALSIMYNTKSRLPSKAVIIPTVDCTRFFHYHDVRDELVRLLYIFFYLWVETIEDVYQLPLIELAQKFPEYSKLINYIESLESIETKPDYDFVKKQLENQNENGGL